MDVTETGLCKLTQEPKHWSRMYQVHARNAIGLHLTITFNGRLDISKLTCKLSSTAV